MSQISSTVLALLEFLVYSFIFAVGAGVLWLVVIYFRDKTQTDSTLRRNYPVVARFRYFFEHMGEFFRQYFFALDREEMPFNRAERSWVYRAAKNVDSTVAFGSTRDLRPTGTVYFVNCPFPTLEQDAKPPSAVTIGPYARHPYTTDSVFNISGMSYGAISVPAVRALSQGARKPASGSTPARAACPLTTWKAAPTSCSRSAPANSACASPKAALTRTNCAMWRRMSPSACSN